MFNQTSTLYWVKFSAGGTLGSSQTSIIPFKAYLEKSDITFTPEDVQLATSPAAATNNKLSLKLTHLLSFTIKVFAEDRDEAIENYRNLKKLINTVKPKYIKYGTKTLPSRDNIEGLLNIDFKGLPLEQNPVKIHLQGFSYTINKELGFIELPKTESNKGKLYVASDMELVPVGFEISVSGRINFSLRDTAVFTEEKVASTSSAAPAPAAPAAAPAPAAAAAPAAATATTGLSGYVANYIATISDPASATKLRAVLTKHFSSAASTETNIVKSGLPSAVDAIKKGLAQNSYSTQKELNPPIFLNNGNINANPKWEDYGVYDATTQKAYQTAFEDRVQAQLTRIKSMLGIK
jgi:hypothetical protein